jgi:hypothetical protein
LCGWHLELFFLRNATAGRAVGSQAYAPLQVIMQDEAFWSGNGIGNAHGVFSARYHRILSPDLFCGSNPRLLVIASGSVSTVVPPYGSVMSDVPPATAVRKSANGKGRAVATQSHQFLTSMSLAFMSI